jgi:hypothetical protein
MSSSRGSVVKRSAETNSVKVGVRIRPRNQKELDAQMPVCFGPNGSNNEVEEFDESGDIVKSWPYDNIFGPGIYLSNYVSISLSNYQSNYL